MASDVFLLCRFVELSPNSFRDIVGGVLDPVGVGNEGVVGLAEISTEIPLSTKSSIVMAAVPRGSKCVSDNFRARWLRSL